MAYKRSGETRARILTAAAGLFADRGYYETDVLDIARAAGISRAAFYYYYDDKEKVARAIFDSYVDKIYAAAETAVPADRGDNESLMLRIFVKYILLFKFVALNRATHAVYYDLVNFADYDKSNIERLEHTTYADTRRLAAAYGKELSDAELVAFIVTTNSVAKAIFKAMSNGILRFSLAQAADYFFKHAVLPDVALPERAYQRLLRKALGLCEVIELVEGGIPGAIGDASAE